MNSSEINLSSFTTQEACWWLLSALNVADHLSNPYSRPYINYVLSWPDAVPISAIIIMQNPYNKNIFGECAAAMSYDVELCKKNMNGMSVPPTVQVLANDLYINANVPISDTIDVIKDGWMLIHKGIILINESVFHSYDPIGVNSYMESVKQCAVIIRLLQETEKYGKKTIDVYAFGESGERVGSNICSWYKSNVIRLTKHKVTHPAGVARRYSNLYDPKCHMDTPSFSKSMGKYISNCVAYVHTMSGKKDEKLLRLARLESLVNNIVIQFQPAAEAGNELAETMEELSRIVQDPSLKELVDRLKQRLISFDSRILMATSVIATFPTQGSDNSVSSLIARAGPSLKYSAASEVSISNHVSRAAEEASPIAPVKVRLKPKTTPKKVPAANSISSGVHVSPPPSIVSVAESAVSAATSVQSNKVVLKPRRLVSTTTPTRSSSNNNVNVTSPASVVSPSIRKPTFEVPKAVNKTGSSNNTADKYSLKLEHINVLSAISALVSLYSNYDEGSVEEEEIEGYLETIQHDIATKKIYNHITIELTDAINKDMELNLNYNIIDLVAGTNDDVKNSNTFKVCKEKFLLKVE